MKVDLGRRSLQAEASLDDRVMPGVQVSEAVAARNWYATEVTVTFVSSVTPPGLRFLNDPPEEWTTSVPVSPSKSGKPGRNGDAAWVRHDSGTGAPAACPPGKHHSVVVNGHYYNPASDHHSDLQQGVLTCRC